MKTLNITVKKVSNGFIVESEGNQGIAEHSWQVVNGAGGFLELNNIVANLKVGDEITFEIKIKQ